MDILLVQSPVACCCDVCMTLQGVWPILVASGRNTQVSMEGFVGARGDVLQMMQANRPPRERGAHYLASRWSCFVDPACVWG